MVLLIIHASKSKDGRANEARWPRQRRGTDSAMRVYGLRKVSDKHSTPRSLSQTQARARAKDRTQVDSWGHTSRWATYERGRSDRHQPTREWKAHSPLGQSTPCECTCICTGERERSRMRQCCLEGGYFRWRTCRHGSVPKLPAEPSDSESRLPPFPPGAGGMAAGCRLWLWYAPASAVSGHFSLATALLAVREAVMA
jgi:hypothetical protein